jgi:hypothetical protein
MSKGYATTRPTSQRKTVGLLRYLDSMNVIAKIPYSPRSAPRLALGAVLLLVFGVSMQLASSALLARTGVQSASSDVDAALRVAALSEREMHHAHILSTWISRADANSAGVCLPHQHVALLHLEGNTWSPLSTQADPRLRDAVTARCTA